MVKAMKDTKFIFRLKTQNRRALDVLAELWEVNKGEVINALIDEKYQIVTQEVTNDFAV